MPWCVHIRLSKRVQLIHQAPCFLALDQVVELKNQCDQYDALKEVGANGSNHGTHHNSYLLPKGRFGQAIGSLMEGNEKGENSLRELEDKAHKAHDEGGNKEKPKGAQPLLREEAKNTR